MAANVGAGQQTATQDELAAMRRQIAEQQAQLDAQARLIEAQRRDLEALLQRVDAAQRGATAGAGTAVGAPPAAASAPTGAAAAGAAGDRANKSATTSAQASAQASAADRDQAQASRRVPELPTEVVSAGDFPGSIRIPGTDAAFKVGGQSRMTMVHTLAALGSDDRFVTSSIPVDEPAPADEARTVYSPQASRINVDVRTPGRLGTLRTFIEADFAGSGHTMRLRHAFTQGRRWLFGQTWSTFSDPEAEPIGIDFEGLNAISLFRQPQVRFTTPLNERLRLSLALEDPAPDLTNAQGVSLTPDFIARLRWEPAGFWWPGLWARAQHVQASILVRQLRGELTDRPETKLTTGGFGANVSGVLIPRWRTQDRLKFAVNAGWGIGRYITDLGTLGGQDAIYDPDIEALHALAVSSGYFGYELAWRSSLTTALTYGIVNVSNLDIQPQDALRRTQRGTLNLTWSPVPQADLVVEFLTGTRVNKDGHHGASGQIQVGWTYRF